MSGIKIDELAGALYENTLYHREVNGTSRRDEVGYLRNRAKLALNQGDKNPQRFVIAAAAGQARHMLLHEKK